MKKIKTWKDIKDSEKLEKAVIFWLFAGMGIIIAAGIYLLGN